MKKKSFSGRLAVSDIMKMLDRKFRSVVRMVYFAQKTTGHFIGRPTY